MKNCCTDYKLLRDKEIEYIRRASNRWSNSTYRQEPRRGDHIVRHTGGTLISGSKLHNWRTRKFTVELNNSYLTTVKKTAITDIYNHSADTVITGDGDAAIAYRYAFRSGHSRTGRNQMSSQT